MNRCRAPARQGSPVEASLDVRFDHDHRDQDQDGGSCAFWWLFHQLKVAIGSIREGSQYSAAEVRAAKSKCELKAARRGILGCKSIGRRWRVWPTRAIDRGDECVRHSEIVLDAAASWEWQWRGQRGRVIMTNHSPHSPCPAPPVLLDPFGSLSLCFIP